MAYIKNTWVDQEVERPKTYEMVNNSDGSVTLVDSFGLVSELGTPVNADNMNHIEDGIGDHEDRITILEEGQDTSNFLNKTQITNCLLEIPQRIKLELNNGVLTLKAGSEVIVPNGFEADGTTPKFDYVTVESDVSFGNWAVFTNANSFILYNPTQKTITPWEKALSGPTPPAADTHGIWYDTAYNLVNWTEGGNSNWNAGMSLPIALVDYVNGIPTSIGQIFNGFGYIGYTTWLDKGVKALIPDRRNEDGSLKNIEVTTSSLKTVGYATYYKDYHLVITRTGNLGIYVSNSGGQPDRCEYKEAENINYNNHSKQQEFIVNVGKLSCDGTSITSFQPKQPFRAVDYNDLQEVKQNALTVSNKAEIVSWGMPDYTAGVVKSIGTTYTADRDGIIVLYVDGQGGSGSLVKMFINNVCVNRSQAWMRDGGQGWHCWGLVPKGSTYWAESNMFTGGLNFYPLKGVK